MSTNTVPIGEFSKLTHLSVKALRHYHAIGLLEPAAIDTESSYRRYDTDQEKARVTGANRWSCSGPARSGNATNTEDTPRSTSIR